MISMIRSSLVLCLISHIGPRVQAGEAWTGWLGPNRNGRVAD